MKFPTALILTSGLLAGVLAAPHQKSAMGSVDAIDPPMHGQPADHGAINTMPGSDASALILHNTVSPDHGAVLNPYREKRQDVYNTASDGNVLTGCVKDIATCLKRRHNCWMSCRADSRSPRWWLEGSVGFGKREAVFCVEFYVHASQVKSDRKMAEWFGALVYMVMHSRLSLVANAEST
ncbi:uncharacterized protein BO66DRAFT_399472 [Aspergillus aculeatinus CBS 121060]|uniref:Uncharacterized protein n=1 Tax=Aspergillus aculeatinus CBS 121060 TaxID=1448322 RepID=A0ACD1HGJ5_9EURO|nr:hypothetical protein BO66DRAFT_399472 [Aspergillus aculeatinus CBS 121060]RAH72536.1 hypothetical protein BO66DRAFT_399472 [Aspergillus aculeatinus CBS 121060]